MCKDHLQSCATCTNKVCTSCTRCRGCIDSDPPPTSLPTPPPLDGLGLADESVTLTNVLDFLKAEGYTETKDSFKEDDGWGAWMLVTVSGGDSITDEMNCYNEVGYTVHRYVNKDDVMDYIGVLECGGHYTTYQLFRFEKNMGEKPENGHIIPFGNTEIFRRVYK